VEVGKQLLELARATGAPSLFIVGTGKNVGKTVAMRAIYEASVQAGMRVGLTSIGRDGEASDIGDAQPKPRLFLRPGTVVATARDVLPRSPACEMLEFERLATAAGTLIYARVAQGAYYELVGPPTASGLRSAVNGILRYAEYAIVDGAIDRVAALAGGNDAIVVSCGASASGTMDQAVSAVRALIARLSIPAVDAMHDSLSIEDALTPSRASELIAAGERRQVVVRDPTQIALTGAAALHAIERLTLRCERPLRVVAATVASIGRERSFEPQRFSQAVASATCLPVFDVYAGTVAA
jgi:hypothetical protein